MTKTSRVRFHNYLFRLRRIRGFSQKQFAMLIGLKCRKAISAFESGRRLPELKVALSMEIVLGAKLSEIYPDLYGHLGQHAVSREDLLPPRLSRHIRGRVLGKDQMPASIPTGDTLRFRPRTVRQFLIFHIAYRFDDLRNLGRYLNTCINVGKDQLLDAARAAEHETLHAGSHAPDNFWNRLDHQGKEGA